MSFSLGAIAIAEGSVSLGKVMLFDALAEIFPVASSKSKASTLAALVALDAKRSFFDLK